MKKSTICAECAAANRVRSRRIKGVKRWRPGGRGRPPIYIISSQLEEGFSLGPFFKKPKKEAA